MKHCNFETLAVGLSTSIALGIVALFVVYPFIVLFIIYPRQKQLASKQFSDEFYTKHGSLFYELET